MSSKKEYLQAANAMPDPLKARLGVDGYDPSVSVVSEHLRILHVEDNPNDAELIEYELQRAGMNFVVQRVDNETDYIRGLAEFLPEVILSDFHIPDFGGAQALAIRNRDVPDIPFIYASGTIGEEVAIEALRNGATDYVLKGNLKRLPSAVQRALSEMDERKGRRQADAEIVRQRKFLRQIIDLDPNFIFAKDREGRFVLVNQAVAEAYGIPVEELLGKTDADFNADAEQVRQFRKFDLDVMDSLRDAFIPEETITDASGEKRWLQTIKRPILSENGTADMVLGVSADITERKKADERIRRLNRVYAVLSGINGLIVRVRDRDELFREACRIAAEAGEFASADILLIDPDSKQTKLAASSSIDARYLEALRQSLNNPAPEAQAFRDKLYRQKQPLVLNDIEHDVPASFQDGDRIVGARAACVLPLVTADQTVGILTLRAREAGFFDAEEMKLLLELAGDIAFALDNLDKTEKLDYLAYYDQLTGLANATLFRERLGQHLQSASGNQQRIALALLDVVRFKTFNDALGRPAGDALLKQLAGRLADCVGSPDKVAHLGTDHFALVLSDVKDADQVARIIEHEILCLIDNPFLIAGTDYKVAVKIGIAFYPGDGANPDTLFRNAEAALKKAKSGGERYLFYSGEMNARVAERLILENQLRRALEREEFVLHYQPKIASASGQIVGVEALIRWNDPKTGLVPPMLFIPLLEETGLILEVGAWALRRAVRDHRHWLEQGLAAPRIAVNVSAIQLRQHDFVEVVRQSLAAGASPPGIDLEITESLIMEDIEGNIGKLKTVRDMGLNIAIDDFGTGYSSLAYLARLPVQTLKIDRSFVITMLQDPNTMTLVSTIISLAHSLGLKVVAEGVDQEEQARMLRQLRCDEMQGYLFSEPVSFPEMSALIGKGFSTATIGT